MVLRAMAVCVCVCVCAFGPSPSTDCLDIAWILLGYCLLWFGFALFVLCGCCVCVLCLHTEPSDSLLPSCPLLLLLLFLFRASANSHRIGACQTSTAALPVLRCTDRSLLGLPMLQRRERGERERGKRRVRRRRREVSFLFFRAAPFVCLQTTPASFPIPI